MGKRNQPATPTQRTLRKQPPRTSTQSGDKGKQRRVATAQTVAENDDLLIVKEPYESTGTVSTEEVTGTHGNNANSFAALEEIDESSIESATGDHEEGVTPNNEEKTGDDENGPRRGKFRTAKALANVAIKMDISEEDDGSSDSNYFDTTPIKIDDSFDSNSSAFMNLTPLEAEPKMLQRLIEEREKDLDEITAKLQFDSPPLELKESQPPGTAPIQAKKPKAKKPKAKNDVGKKLSFAKDNKTNPDNPDNPDAHSLSTKSSSKNGKTPSGPLLYVDAARGEGEFTPPPVDTEKACRYSLRVVVEPDIAPMKILCSALKHFFTHVKNSIGGKIGLAVYAPNGPSLPTLVKVSEFPEGKQNTKDKKFMNNYFDHYPKLRSGKAYTAYLRVRIVTDDPTKLTFPLTEIGEYCSEDLEEESTDPLKKHKYKIMLSRNPQVCQATKSEVVGWLFRSTKTINEHTFLPAIRKQLDIPSYVAIGIAWKTLRKDDKKSYPWDQGSVAPQALTIEIDADYCGIFAPKMAKLFKKRSTTRICGLNLRLVPCFTSPAAEGLEDETLVDTRYMAQKQQWFVNHHIAKLPPTAFILELDHPIPHPENKEDIWTLRRYLMKQAPIGYPAMRLFVTVDQTWDGKGHVAITCKIFYKEALRALTRMIPECLHVYGPRARRWFTNTGLAAASHIAWDPKAKRTISTDTEAADLVTEDFMGMGKAWQTAARPDTVTEVDGRPTTTVEASMDAAATNPTTNNPSPTTVATSETPVTKVTPGATPVLRQADASSVKSFGDAFGRDHDGNTVQTQAPSTSPHAEDDEHVPGRVTMDLTGMEVKDHTASNEEDDTVTVSTMGNSTSARLQLREVKTTNRRLVEANEAIAQENEALQERMAVMERQITLLMQHTTLKQPPPAIGDGHSTVAGGAGSDE